ncbi:MAG TPA: M20/M25/M40 family metallo-hydrolase [Anaerolineae bacterium]|nr:M20/M25/M40 family metallo-hydrolase [Anaerolineae bacterium]
MMMLNIDWQKLTDDCVDFTQRLIQTPSMPYEEEAIAALIGEEMKKLGFDEVWGDEVGNIYGRVYGEDRSLGALVLNTHLDHVDPGEPSLWPVPPFSGEIVGERICGRGACDIKGPLAVQIYSMGALLRAGVRPRRDVVFTGVVEEEIGGTGSAYWVENLDYEVDLVVLGEPSENRVALGHRGIMQFWVQFNGRSVHASVPDKGDNPNYALATFLTRLESARRTLRVHPHMGQTSVAPTIVEVDTKSANVTPAWTRVLLDIRTASDSPVSVLAMIGEIASDLNYEVTTARPCVTDAPDLESDEIVYGFDTDGEDEDIKRAVAAISEGMGREVELGYYQFATDGRLFVPYGLKIIGYSPSEEHLAHTIKESILIPKMAEGLRGHVGLMLGF